MELKKQIRMRKNYDEGLLDLSTSQTTTDNSQTTTKPMQ